MAELEIIGVAQSNYVWAVRIAATEKGVPYKFTPAAPEHGRGRRHPPVQQDPGDAPRRFRALRVRKPSATYIDRAFDGPP